MEESRQCARCKAYRPIGEFQHGKNLNDYRRNCLACRKTMRTEKYAQEADKRAEAKVTTGAKEARFCKVCGLEKPLDVFRLIQGKYRLHTCEVCQKIKERQYDHTSAARQVRYAKRKQRRKEGRLHDPGQTERSRRYRETPLGKLASLVKNRRSWIKEFPKSPSVPKWRAELKQIEEMRVKLRRDLDCTGKRGRKTPGYGSIRIPNAEA